MMSNPGNLIHPQGMEIFYEIETARETPIRGFLVSLTAPTSYKHTRPTLGYEN